MRVVAAPLTFEITAAADVTASAVTATTGALIVILGHKTLVSDPGQDQRAVYVEVFTREQIALLRNGHNLVEELDDSIVFDQALAVFW